MSTAPRTSTGTQRSGDEEDGEDEEDVRNFEVNDCFFVFFFHFATLQLTVGDRGES